MSVNAVLKEQAQQQLVSSTSKISRAVQRLTGGGLSHRRRGYGLTTDIGHESLLQEADADAVSVSNSTESRTKTSSGSTGEQTNSDSSRTDYTDIVPVVAEVQGRRAALQSGIPDQEAIDGGVTTAAQGLLEPSVFPVATAGIDIQPVHSVLAGGSPAPVPVTPAARNDGLNVSREYYNLNDVALRSPKPPRLTVSGHSDYYNLIYYPPKGEAANGEQGQTGTGTGSSSYHMHHDSEATLRKHEIRRKLVHGEAIAEESDYAGLTRSFWEQVRTAERTKYHTIILDCLPIVFIDSAGAQTLHQVCTLLFCSAVYECKSEMWLSYVVGPYYVYTCIAVNSYWNSSVYICLNRSIVAFKLDSQTEVGIQHI